MNKLDLGIDYGAITTLNFATQVQELANGKEQRIITQTQPLLSFQVGDRMINDRERDVLETMHGQTKGAAGTFLIRDWTDFEIENQLQGTGNGITTDFQLIKRYSANGLTVRRPITAPERITVTGGGAYTLGPNGRIVFAVPPPNKARIYARGTFNVPVRFETDDLLSRFEALDDYQTLFQAESIRLMEVRQPSLPIFDPITPDLEALIDLGVDYGTAGGPAYKTAIATVASGYERRDANWNTPRWRWNVGDRALLVREKDHFISLFRMCRGAGCTFKYFSHARREEVRVRFEENTMSLRFDAYDVETGNALYQFLGVPIVETIPL